MKYNIAGLCFTNAHGIAFTHDPALVILSYMIAVAGSFAALEMIARWRLACVDDAPWWWLASAVALGSSIWSMHFIGILAVRIGFPLTYAPAPTVISLLIAIGAVAAGMQVVRADAAWLRVGCAGVIIGLGVAAMHYTGMSGVRFPGSLAYTPGLWGLSVLVGIAAATVAIGLSLTLHSMWQRMIAALVMAAGICGMHYTGMASTVFLFDPLAPYSPGLATGPIAVPVAVATLALIICALVFVAADRRLLAASERNALALRDSSATLAQVDASLVLSHQRLDAVLDNIPQGISLFDVHGRLLVSNRRYAEIYKLPPELTRIGTPLTDILLSLGPSGTAPEISDPTYLEWASQIGVIGQPGDTVVSLTNGRVIAIHYRPMPGRGTLMTHEDITERQLAAARIAFMAQHDALTGLANRVLFQERLDQAMVLAGRGAGCAILCLDIDHFKLINDALGHPAGDRVLQAAAERLQSCIRNGDTVARLGGDEFAIIQLAIHGPGDAERLATRILAAFKDRIAIDGHQIAIGVSIGVAVAPGDGAAYETLLKNADVALYLAKSEGRGAVRFFEPEMDARINRRRTLESELAAAMATGAFELYYQPLINLLTGDISGFEALLRWNHPVRGLVPPLEFIRVAEETGLIVALGAWVLQTACREATNWPDDISVAVNLSPVQFNDGTIVGAVAAALAGSGLQPGRLELEITETVVLRETPATLTALLELRAMGVMVALDDFGTGYSSLSYLRSFPFDKIKIDQSFVREIATNRESMSIVRAVTGLGHGLRMKTTAEGVETMEQLNLLRAEGCTEVQGYIFSPPRPAHELPELIKTLHLKSLDPVRGSAAV
jgi:diguanylate cyclase (GGDEF)-like protein